jgi:hypothetical protein
MHPIVSGSKPRYKLGERRECPKHFRYFLNVLDLEFETMSQGETIDWVEFIEASLITSRIMPKSLKTIPPQC